MATSSQPYSGTYFVQDQQNQEELFRLAEQDQLITMSMGKVLAEQTNPGLFRHVLDVACGVGGWVIEAAKTYPDMTLVGIDINPYLIAYAQEHATKQQVDDRVEFRVMDALRPLDFPPASFDLVNLRFAMSFVRTWEWPRLIGSLMRVLRPDGIIRLTEEHVIHQSSSPASMRFCEMLLCALFRSGHLFTQESSSLTDRLASLLQQQNGQQVQTQPYTLYYQAGTPEGQAYIRDGMRVLRTLRPFLEKWGCINEDYEELSQAVYGELHQPDFTASWHLVTIWAKKAQEAFAL